jgi:N-carbamoylputrescine amidase
VRVTVCELPHESAPLAAAWASLCNHVANHGSELVLLPEFAFVEPLWEQDSFEVARWDESVARSNAWLPRLGELGATHVVSTRPAAVGRRHFNEGYLWSGETGAVPLRSKWFLPDEPGGWEARWFMRGHREFPRFTASRMSFGLNICTELWALDTYASYAQMGIHAVLCPRATGAATAGKCWIIGPDGDLLAATTRDSPFCTFDLDFGVLKAASRTYPRYVFART